MNRLPLAATVALALTACVEPALRSDIEVDGATGRPDPAVAADPAQQPTHRWIREIVAADYAGDRPTLERLYNEADAYLVDRAVESRVRYWKGFAKWRRSMNGANDNVDPAELAIDAELAADELRRSADLDPAFVDARIGEMQCLGLLMYFDRRRAGDPERISRLRTLMTELKDTAADNPRYVWAWGMAYFRAPPERGGGPENVIQAYSKALDAMRSHSATTNSPLDPTWGEPELCVNLAYSYLNRPSPDLALARRYVDEAVRLVPSWHYARDILRAQVEAAERKANADSAGS